MSSSTLRSTKLASGLTASDKTSTLQGKKDPNAIRAAQEWALSKRIVAKNINSIKTQASKCKFGQRGTQNLFNSPIYRASNNNMNAFKAAVRDHKLSCANDVEITTTRRNIAVITAPKSTNLNTRSEQRQGESPCKALQPQEELLT